jgi:hypothetical protein
MTLEQVLIDLAATAGAVAGICTILAHLPFMPPVWAERFARVALYASQAFSVNRRDTMPKDEPPPSAPKAPFLPMLMFALAWGALVLFTLSGCRETVPPVAPCDVTTVAAITAECSAQAFQCGKDGIPKEECTAIDDCNRRLDARKAECSQ